MSQCTTYTHCTICVACCGLKVTSEDNTVIKIEPDKEAVNWRDFCVRAAESHRSLQHPSRITQPMKRVGDEYVPVPYKQAVKEIAQQLGDIVQRHGPHALGSYTGNPATSNFGAFSFFSLFLDAIGTDNRYFVGSLDQNSHHYVCEEMYELPWAFLQPDVENTDCLLLVGANPAVSELGWVFSVSEGWKKAQAMRARGGTVYVVDPRRTESAAKADCHISPLPETDWALLLAILHVIASNAWHDPAVAEYCENFDELIAMLKAQDVEALSARCEVPVATIEEVARTFSKGSGICLAQTGVGQTSTGSVSLWLSHLLNLITGNMRGKGGLYHNKGGLDMVKTGGEFFPKVHRTSRVNQASSVGGFLPFAEAVTEMLTPGEGQIRAFIIHGGNPVITGPEGEKLNAAMADLDLLIAVDSFQRESHRHADWLIPAPSYLELDEVSILLQEIANAPSLQMLRSAVKKPEGVPYEWEFFRDLTLAMNKPLLLGKPALNWLVKGYSLIAKITGNPYDGFSPKQVAKQMYKTGGQVSYKQIENSPHGYNLDPTIDYEYLTDNLPTESGKVRTLPVDLYARLNALLASPSVRPDKAEYPLQLISRRRKHMMNSWLTEGSMQQMKRPESDIIEVNQEDAARWQLQDGEWVSVSSRVGAVQAQLLVSDKIRPGVAVMSHGWGNNTYNPNKKGDVTPSGGVNRNLLVANDDRDPLTGVPKLNGTSIKIEALQRDVA